MMKVRLSYCTSEPWTAEKVPNFILYENGDVLFTVRSGQPIRSLQYRKVHLAKEEVDEILSFVSTEWSSYYPATTISDIGAVLLDAGGPEPVTIDGAFGTQAEDEKQARRICEQRPQPKVVQASDSFLRCLESERRKYPPEALKRLISLVSNYQNPRSEEWVSPCWNIWLRATEAAKGPQTCKPFPNSLRSYFPGIEQAKERDWISVVLPFELYRKLQQASSRETDYEEKPVCFSDGRRAWEVEWRPRFPRDEPRVCLKNR